MVYDRRHVGANEFRAALASNQRLNLVREIGSSGSSAESVLDFFLNRLSVPFDQSARGELLGYLKRAAPRTGSRAVEDESRRPRPAHRRVG